MKFEFVTAKRMIVFLVVAFCAYNIYDSRDTNDLSNNALGAIDQAALYSYYIREGDKKQLDAKSIGFAKVKLQSDPLPSMANIALWSELLKDGVKPPVRHYLWSPVKAVFEDPKASVQLVLFEKFQNFYLATFSGNQDESSQQPVTRAGEPMLISVAVRYYSGTRDSIVAEYFRKICNLSFMPAFIKAKGDRGGWVLVDYNYSYTTRQYYDWVVQNGEALYAQAEKEKSEFKEGMTKSFIENMQANAEKHHDVGLVWTNNRLPNQTLQAMQYIAMDK